MVCQQKPIVIDPASIVAVGEAKTKRMGRPRKDAPLVGTAKTRGFHLSSQASDALGRAAAAFGVSESALIEAFAQALTPDIYGAKNS